MVASRPTPELEIAACLPPYRTPQSIPFVNQSTSTMPRIHQIQTLIALFCTVFLLLIIPVTYAHGWYFENPQPFTWMNTSLYRLALCFFYDYAILNYLINFGTHLVPSMHPIKDVLGMLAVTAQGMTRWARTYKLVTAAGIALVLGFMAVAKWLPSREDEAGGAMVLEHRLVALCALCWVWKWYRQDYERVQASEETRQ